MLDFDEIFTATKYDWYMSYDTISRFVTSLHLLQDSRKGHGGWVESLQGSWCWILMKFSEQLHMIDTCHMTPSPGSSGTSMSSKNPGRDLESWQSSLCWILMKFSQQLNMIENSSRNSRKRHGGKMESWESSQCLIMMKLSQNYPFILQNHWISRKGYGGKIESS